MPLLLQVLPLVEGGQVITAEQLRVDRAEVETLAGDAHQRAVRLTLPSGRTVVRHDALVNLPAVSDREGVERAEALEPGQLSLDLLRYTWPSRFCESDRLGDFAWQTFGQLEPGWPRVRAVTDWVHQNLEYRFGSGAPHLSAWDVFQRGYGVCRDFAHLTVALCRALNVPARYASGHLPDIAFVDPGTPMDFHAYAEVFLGGRWFAMDARYNVPRIGRIKISHGLDAAHCAFGTAYGPVELQEFDVWAYQVEPGTIALGDPIDLSKRLDGTVETRFRLRA
ncbi:MAG TPA: transglutaminase family protein [Candidatus Synoicihabitans sp.]|nr:transglutaminase family protein [Candidatus Synoicihabitans sp.]